MTKWSCFSKAAFTHPNPYFGDVNVSEEFSNIIDFSLILAFCGTFTSLFSLVRLICRKDSNQILIAIDAILAVGYFTWLIYATVARFSHTGRVCSGAYQGATEIMYPYDYYKGEFIFWAVLLGWSIPGTILLATRLFCPLKSSLYRPSSEFQTLDSFSDSKESFANISAISK